MMKYISIMLCLSAVLAGPSFGVPELLLPDARITVRVVDESGLPVTNANVGIGFDQGGNTWIGEHKSGSIKGLSDTNGLFSAQAKCMGGIGFGAEKKGFYPYRGEYKYPGTYQNKQRWEPWNPTNEVILKEIKKPIAMFVKRVRTEVPIVGEPIGFDFGKGDWTAPYGKGVASDLFFCAELEQRSNSEFNYKLHLTFPNEKDGIQSVTGFAPRIGSKFRSGYQAPMDGYLSDWQQYRIRKPKIGETNNIDANRIFYFRIRTKEDEHGNIISAQYGKIYGDFLQFTYYLNPVINDPNLEYDPDRNLFGGRDRFSP